MSINNSSGEWTGIGYGYTANYNSGKKNEVFISDRDRQIIRDLAKNVKELSSREIETKKRELWYKHNSLKTNYPLIFADPENGWNEIITPESLECEGKLSRRWELVLKKEIFWGEQMKDDKPIEPLFIIGYTHQKEEFIKNNNLKTSDSNGAYTWDGFVKGLKDLRQIKFPEIDIDFRTTLDTFELANETLGDILTVKLKGVWWWGLVRSRDLSEIVGLEKMFMYFYDKPELIQALMEMIKKRNIEMLGYLEKNNLLSLNNDGSYVGSGGLGYTDELPSNKYNGRTVKTNDLWGSFESQETGQISPSMFEEFIFKYQRPVAAKFGLNCYGCCEPLEKRWHIIKYLPNLRRVSVSPWSDTERMVEFLEDKFIYSFKANPSDIASEKIDASSIRNKIRVNLRKTKNSILEIIMKDNHTLGKNPENITRWVRIVREEIINLHG